MLQVHSCACKFFMLWYNTGQKDASEHSGVHYVQMQMHEAQQLMQKHV